MARLQDKFKAEIGPNLQKSLGLNNPMRIPRITKITLNMGLGEATGNKKVLESATEDLRKISGQQPIIRNARRSEAAFKIREGWPIGAKVTMRRARMYEFLDRLISVAIPRIRDFRGLNPKSFDGRGNYAFGLTEQIVFPEIDFDKIDALRGMDVCITIDAESDEHAKALLTEFNFPLKS